MDNYGILSKRPEPFNGLPQLELLVKQQSIHYAEPQNEYMLPVRIFRLLNCLFFFALAYCVHRLVTDKKFLPSPAKSSAETVFKIVLALHSAYYVAELFFSNIVDTHLDSAVHHVASIVLFALTWLEPTVISAVYVLPYWVHSGMWVFYDFSTLSLAAYNISLAFAIIAILHFSFVNRAPAVSRRLLIGAYMLLVSNYTIYCFSSKGGFCPPQYFKEAYYWRYIELSLLSVIIFYGIAITYVSIFINPTRKHTIKVE